MSLQTKRPFHGLLLARLFASATILLLAAATLPLAALEQPTAKEVGLCSTGTPHLVLETPSGSVVIALDEDAAPAAVYQLGTAVRESPGGLFGAALFNYAKPHVELRTELPNAAAEMRLPTQIDPAALGLDERRIESAGEAMDVWQFQIFKTYALRDKSAAATPVLASWLETWSRTRDASFLIGKSRGDIHRALGYADTPGLPSRAPERGTVALEPASAGESKARLSFALADMPQRAGRWMVIGEVREGLEIVESIANRPLARGEKGFRYRRPAAPEQIDTARLVCQEIL